MDSKQIMQMVEDYGNVMKKIGKGDYEISEIRSLCSDSVSLFRDIEFALLRLEFSSVSGS